VGSGRADRNKRGDRQQAAILGNGWQNMIVVLHETIFPRRFDRSCTALAHAVRLFNQRMLVEYSSASNLLHCCLQDVGLTWLLGWWRRGTAGPIGWCMPPKKRPMSITHPIGVGRRIRPGLTLICPIGFSILKYGYSMRALWKYYRITIGNRNGDRR
jgi:hypothetical protein